MITRITDNTTIENLNIISCIDDDNKIIFYEVFPEEGYVIRTPIYDEVIEDKDGNKLLAIGYASAMTETATYDWKLNINKYSVEPYSDGVFNEVVAYEATEDDYINALLELGVNFNE